MKFDMDIRLTQSRQIEWCDLDMQSNSTVGASQLAVIELHSVVKQYDCDNKYCHFLMRTSYRHVICECE